MSSLFIADCVLMAIPFVAFIVYMLYSAIEILQEEPELAAMVIMFVVFMTGLTLSLCSMLPAETPASNLIESIPPQAEGVSP